MSLALIEQALQHHRAGRFNEAIMLYEQVLASAPDNPDALHLYGLAQLQTGAADRAIDLIQRAIRFQPKNPAFHSNLGAALTERGRPGEALRAFQQAAKLNPAEPQYEMAIANCHALCGEHDEAEKRLRKLLQRFPQYALGWLNLGNALRDQDRYEDAIHSYQRAVSLDNSLADAHNNLGSLLHRMERLEPAATAYRRAVALEPQHAVMLCNLGSVLIDLGKFNEAEAVCRRAITAAPDSATAHSFLAAALGHQGRLRESLASSKRAAALDPENVSTIIAIGATLQELGESDQALPWLREAEQRAPDAVSVQQVLSSVLLAQCQWREGWRRYVHREARSTFVRKLAPIKLQTQFEEVLAGKTVVLLREQGLGDEIFFLRFAPELAHRGARVHYRSGIKIAGMVGRVPAIAEIIAESTPLPVDAPTMLIGDLPNALGLLTVKAAQAKNSSTINAAAAADDCWPALPPPLPLTPLADALERIQKKLAETGPPPYVGITWRAGTPPAEQKGGAWLLTKEVSLAKLGQTLSSIPATFIALQRKPAAGEIEALSAAIGRPVHDFCALNDELEDMLALLAVIDEYVGVSNTNMHLRAGVGKTARVLVPRPADWRWLTQGSHSPWFPDFTIYRQSTEGDWQQALGDLASDLRTVIAKQSS